MESKLIFKFVAGDCDIQLNLHDSLLEWTSHLRLTSNDSVIHDDTNTLAWLDVELCFGAWMAMWVASFMPVNVASRAPVVVISRHVGHPGTGFSRQP